jgi:hypothetical protein
MKVSFRHGYLRIATAILLAGVAIAAHCASNVVPLPRLPRGAIEMRVAYVINPRLPRMSDAQLKILLESTKTAAREHFGVELRFAPVREISIESVFGRIPPERVIDANKDIYDFKTGKGDPGRLAAAYVSDFKTNGGPLSDLISFARPYIGELGESSHEALGAAVAKFHLSQIDRWKNIKALDGGPAIDAKPYNEILMWDALGYTELPFELVLTNQLIASVEYKFPAIHAAVRGGYSNGLTTYNKRSRLGTVAIWSTFAFTTDDAWVKQMRDGESYSDEEAARLAGIGATHEIGHQLFHFLHPFGNRACVMNPVPLFAYRAWVARLSPKDCAIGSSPAMRPGAFRFLY